MPVLALFAAVPCGFRVFQVVGEDFDLLFVKLLFVMSRKSNLVLLRLMTSGF